MMHTACRSRHASQLSGRSSRWGRAVGLGLDQLLTENGYARWGLDADPHPVPLDFQHLDHDRVVDHDPLASLARQNQHGLYLLGNSRPVMRRFPSPEAFLLASVDPIFLASGVPALPICAF